METADELLAKALFEGVLSNAIAEVRTRNTPVYTFALYHDHESEAVSVCVDTKASSQQLVRKENAYSMKYFREAVADGDLKEASQWNANAGRSLSLGDFALVNVARASHRDEIVPDDGFYKAMIRALLARRDEIAALAPNRDELLFCCSSANAEVGFMWSVDNAIAE